MVRCTQIQATPHNESDHKDFATALAAVPSESSDDNTNPPPEIPVETEYRLPNPGPNASEDDLRAVRTTILAWIEKN